MRFHIRDIFAEAMDAVGRRLGLASAERISRNNAAKINAKRGYDPNAVQQIKVEPETVTPVQAEPVIDTPKKLSRAARQQAREVIVRRAKLKKATAGRVYKPRPMPMIRNAR